MSGRRACSPPGASRRWRRRRRGWQPASGGLTARADLGFHRPLDDDLVDEVVERLTAYREAGATCLDAPGLVEPRHLARVVALALPVNALIRPGGLRVAELGALGVHRVSTGGLLAWTAYGAIDRTAEELLEAGTVSFSSGPPSPAAR